MKIGQDGVKRWTISRFRVWVVPVGMLWKVLGWRAPMTQSADSEPAQPPEKDRREIAKRIFDALCEKFPQKYVALIQPREPIPAVPNEN